VARDLSGRERALQRWAELVVRDPNSVTAQDVTDLRAAGLSDREILEATAFVGLRLAFSTINDALGARPDAELAASAPKAVREAVAYGRPPAGT
jgi:alkylhydroperoxidase family enzyme